MRFCCFKGYTFLFSSQTRRILFVLWVLVLCWISLRGNQDSFLLWGYKIKPNNMKLPKSLSSLLCLFLEKINENLHFILFIYTFCVAQANKHNKMSLRQNWPVILVTVNFNRLHNSLMEYSLNVHRITSEIEFRCFLELYYYYNMIIS